MGFAAAGFDPEKRDLGAYEGSWCFSKTGKMSDGKDFKAYGNSFKTGDVVTAEVDMEQEVMRFFINGKPQGDRSVKGIRSQTLVPADPVSRSASAGTTSAPSRRAVSTSTDKVMSSRRKSGVGGDSENLTSIAPRWASTSGAMDSTRAVNRCVG